MECSQIQENLSAYLDGELDPGEEAELKSHLEGCETCRSELESLRSTVKLVRSVPRVPAPAVLKQRLRAATSARRPAWRFPGPLAFVTAAALVLVCLVAVFMLNPENTGDSRDVAFGHKREKAVEGLSKKKLPGIAADNMPDRRGAEKVHKNSLGELAEAAGRRKERSFREAEESGKLKREAPSRRLSRGQAVGEGAGAAVPETPADAQGYGDLAGRLEPAKMPEPAAVHRPSEEDPPASPTQLPDQKPAGAATEDRELADRIEKAEDVLEVVIKTHDPAGIAARVNGILEPHIGKKGMITGAMLKGITGAGRAEQGRGEDSVEILVYVDSAKSGEVVGQLQRLAKHADVGWEKGDFDEPATEESSEEEKPEGPAETMRRRLTEREETAGEDTGPGEPDTRKAAPRGGSETEKKQVQKEKAASKEAESLKEEAQREQPLDKSIGQPGEKAPARRDYEKPDSRADEPAAPQSKRVPVLIRIVRAREAPTQINKLLDEKLKPAPADRGK